MKTKKIFSRMTILFVLLTAIICMNGFATAFEMPKQEKVEKAVCPKTKMGKDCLLCHVAPDFKLKEAKPDRTFVYPVYDMLIVENTCFLFISDIDSAKILKVLRYLDWHKEVTKLVFEIHSPGGSVMEAWRMIGMLEEAKSRYRITTRVYGMAASAGFMLFCVGDERVASPTAELMTHEVWSLTIFSVDTPSDKEDEARILRHFQDNIAHWLVKRTTLDKDALDFLIRKKDYWMTGKDAHALGFATKLTYKDEQH